MVSRFKNIVCVTELDSVVLLLLNHFRNRIFVRELCFFVPCFRQYLKFATTVSFTVFIKLHILSSKVLDVMVKYAKIDEKIKSL